MKIVVSATPIHKGKVIEGTHHSHTINAANITAEQVGSVVMCVIANARKLHWHMADPDTFIRLELRHFPEF